jgi:predicted RNA-binding Zn-ribbon protein involved in translation (DUF1610 family)
MPSECFADEIAIDFPSVGHAVERMRHGFLDAREHDDDVLTMDVHLSSREASGGLTIPLEVPVRTTCPACGGRGEVWTERCAKCLGTGGALVHHAVRVTLPAGIVHGARVRFRVRTPSAAPVRVEVRVAIRASA